MTRTQHQMLIEVQKFYEEKIGRYGPVPAGADFNSENAQKIRFQQFIRLLDLSEPFSLIDYGCGYGALADYLVDAGLPLRRYIGFDISMAMIEAARARIPHTIEWQLTNDPQTIGTADFTIASAIFNLKFDTDEHTWQQHILGTLDVFARISRRGFAFNMLTSYSDPEKMRADLKYGDPCWFFDYCKRKFSREVALLHDYELFDWTIAIKF